MMIPGLDVCPPTQEDAAPVPLLGFNGTFTVPKHHIFPGNCHRVGDFEKVKLIKATPAWSFRKCTDKKNDTPVCIKRAKTKNDPDKELANLIREIQIMSSLGQNNVMRFYEPVVAENLECTYLVFECCEIFLSDLIDQQVPELYEKAMVKNLFQQMMQGIEHMHNRLIMHRDINPKNFMINKEGWMKLTNFENAREFSARDLSLEPTSKLYHAPEIILEAPRHGPEVDIWAAGCILAKLFLLGEDLFTGTIEPHIFKRMVNIIGTPREVIWPGCTQLPRLQEMEILKLNKFDCLELHFQRHGPQTLKAISLLKDIFIYNPAYRISASEILKHPYFNEIPEPSAMNKVIELLAKITNKRPYTRTPSIQSERNAPSTNL